MIDRNTHRFLGLFGDAREHHMLEIIKFGSILLRMPEREVESFFKRRLLENGWISREWKSCEPRTDYYRLTPKGDKLFREVQISRIERNGHADQKTVDHFRNFDRTVDGRHGASSMGDFVGESQMYGYN